MLNLAFFFLIIDFLRVISYLLFDGIIFKWLFFKFYQAFSLRGSYALISLNLTGIFSKVKEFGILFVGIKSDKF